MTLPIALSVPHAGLDVPDYLAPYSQLNADEVREDGDVGAQEIYDLSAHVAAFARADVARAMLDLNRAEGDRRKDGIVKTHTCWDIPIWREPPPEELFDRVVREHHRPYHQLLTSWSRRDDLVLALDCHTMAAVGPPVGPDAGHPRPMVCLGDGDGRACPREAVERMRDCMQRHFPGEVTINVPFSGGWVTRSHGSEMPWIQVEMSRTDELAPIEKRERFLAAITAWCEGVH